MRAGTDTFWYVAATVRNVTSTVWDITATMCDIADAVCAFTSTVFNLTATMWDVVASMWAVTDVMCAVMDDAWDFTAVVRAATSRFRCRRSTGYPFLPTKNGVHIRLPELSRENMGYLENYLITDVNSRTHTLLSNKI